MITQIVLYVVLAFGFQNPNAQSPEVQAKMKAQADELRSTLGKATKLPLQRTDIKPTPPGDGWEMGMTSWVAADEKGLIYLLQRGDKADPVIVMNREGKVVRSWGKGMYTMPHAIRV